MPNIRALARPVGVSPFTLIARPLLAIGRFTLTSFGAVLSQAEIRAFKTTTDVLVTRTVSDVLGRYTVSTPDALTYYVVAHQPGTGDSMTLTGDNMSVTGDRMTSVQGVTPKNVAGTS